MMRFLMIAALSLATGCASVRDVRAQDGSDSIPERFYNRPGATTQELALELRRCEAIATGPQGSTVEQRPLTSLGDSASESLVAATGSTQTLEDCMVARGWRVFALSAQESGEWNALAANVRERELVTLVGATHPARGRMIRADGRTLLRKPGL